MRSLLFSFGISILIVNIVNADIVDTTTAKLTGRNFIYEKININNKADYSSINLQYLHTQKSNNVPVYYIFNLENQPGYIIVSAEDETFPVLTYSYEKDYIISDEKPFAFIEWMNHYTDQINYIRENNIKAKKEITQSWLKYNSKPLLLKSDQQKGITPLLSTTWNQGRYYNQLCPSDAAGQDGHVWVGCVAVAMAQVMKYWNYPDYGSDENTYNHWNYGTQTANFANTYYDWASMPNSLSNYNTPVATLLYHCGVAVNMNYGTSGSSAYSGTAASSLKRFFDYSHTLYLASKNSFADTTWKNLIKSELDLGHPLYYSGRPGSGSGHAFNCDGYDGPDHFHFNWGWGGAYDGYFYLDDLTPGSRDYTYSQAAIINAYPDCLDPICNGITIITDPSGTLNDGSPISGYFTNYSNCSNCEYLIQPTNATSIYIEFNSFSTIEGEDSLYVYNGTDDTAPVLLAISGDTLPNNIITSTGSAYFHFVSDNFRTAPGWDLTYTSAYDDVGVTWLYKPIDKTCGRPNDSIELVIKNFGVKTQTNIPVVVDVNTPTGLNTYNAILPGPLAKNEYDTLFAGIINTTEPGDYVITSYTNLIGDTVINSNDTSYITVSIKIPVSPPHAEIFDDLRGNPGDWNDRNWSSYPDYDEDNGNYFMRAWLNQWSSMFLIFDKKIENITSNTNLLFDYRFLGQEQEWPPTDSIVLNSNEKMHIILSSDCGISFDTIYTIDTLNHINTSDFTTLELPLSACAGNDIIVGFTTEWDTIMAIVDIDNVIIVNSIGNNVISENQNVCEDNAPALLSGTSATGGIGQYTYLWQESSDSIIWINAASTNNLQNYTPDLLSDTIYYRRIACDTLIYSDTSNIIHIIKNLNPVVYLGQDTTINANDAIIIDAGAGYDLYLWSTGETTQEITVDSAGTGIGTAVISILVTDSNTCQTSDTLHITFDQATVISDNIKETVIIYPNPTKNTISVKGKNISKIYVINTKGQVINQFEVHNEKYDIDLSSYSKGMYFIKIITNKEIITRRIIKE